MHNLPAALTRFIGRERELSEVSELLAAHRLVTLTGPGGSGKTRLALAVGQAALGAHPDGVWLVELAALQDPALVVPAIATALGVREETGRPLLETVCAHCRHRHLLLLLDNCEHLVAAAAETALRLLQGAPQLSILATSREALAVAGEVAWPVPALGLPDLGLARLEDLSQVESICLFLDRAATARPGFTFNAEVASAVVRICQRLEGNPLAIELAAVRVTHLAVTEIAARLDDRFRLLISGNRGAMPRHQTLQAAVDWSYDLLPAPERSLLTRLAVFTGSFILAAAESVCAGDGVAANQVMDLLSELVRKSLVVAEVGARETRYWMLETIREYADAILLAAGASFWRRRHLEWFTTLAEKPLAEGGYDGPSDWPDRLERDHDNLRAALRWCLDQGEHEAGLRLARALGHFWDARFNSREGLRWLETFLPGAPAPTRIRASALQRAGRLASNLGKYEVAAGYFAESGVIWRSLGDDHCLTCSLMSQGHMLQLLGDHHAAITLLQESADLARSRNDHVNAAHSLNLLAKCFTSRRQAAGSIPLRSQPGSRKRNGQ